MQNLRERKERGEKERGGLRGMETDGLAMDGMGNGVWQTGQCHGKMTCKMRSGMTSAS